MDNQKEVYREEAHELLGELETSLLEMEETPDDPDLIDRVFRALHTIKGSGAMFGFDDIAEFTHEVETVFDLVREGKMKVTRELVNIALAARDRIQAMLEGGDGEGTVGDLISERIISGLRGLIPDGEKSHEGARKDQGPPGDRDPGKGPGSRVSYRIRFKPSLDIFSNGTNPVALLDELREMGECRVIAHTEAIPALEELEPESCYTHWDVIITTDKDLNAIRDVFIFVEDECELSIDVIDDEFSPEDGIAYKKVGEILIERGDLNPRELERALGSQKRIGDILVESGAVGKDKIEAALAEQQHVRDVQKRREESSGTSSIRVAAERLDALVNLVGELVTVQARLSQKAGLAKDPELVSISEEVERLSAELRDNAMSIRMLPIGTTFNKLRRLVRDLSNELGKKVILTTEGGETELDKTVIEKLSDPLVHIIRNSIDHGIEHPETREAAGKAGEGTVILSAAHSGAYVLIEIRDDGAGLDKEVIRAKAVDKGIISPDEDLSERDIFALIFAPGFSTAEKVTGVSGRGVGMDVVKRCIDALNGFIEIKSEKGKGTTITLKLPLTLAIIDGLLLKIRDEHFVLPLSAVEECIELTREDVNRSNGRHMLNVRGDIVPYVPLREQFDIRGQIPEIEQIVITEVNGDRLGFVVDHVIGEYQTVIKSLGRAYRDIEGISGATILGDGTVALILDVPQLAHSAEMDERKVRTAGL